MSLKNWWFFIVNNSNLILIVIFVLLIFIILVQYKQNNKLLNRINELGEKMFFSRNETYQNTVNAINPFYSLIKNFQDKIDNMEGQRKNERNEIVYGIRTIGDLQKEVDRLREQLVKFTNVFKRPQFAGKWGETQLQKICELTGMLPFCQFEFQYSFADKRPDMVLKLPNGGFLFVDCKTPMDDYIKFLDGEKDVLTPEKAIRSHINQLSKKNYWQGENAPQFVVMFIPIESIWLSALEKDPSLFELAVKMNIIVCTPMSFVALCKTIFLGWEQVHLAKEAQSIKDNLYNYMNSLNDNVGKLSSLSQKCLESMEEVNTISYRIMQEQKNVRKIFSPDSTDL